MIEINKSLKFSDNFSKYLQLKTFLLCLLISPITLGFSFLFWVIIAVYVSIDNSKISFFLDTNQITLNYGIFVKTSKTLVFKNIQNTRLISGPLMRMFKLTRVELWSSSFSQIHRGEQGVETRPDIILYLDDVDVDAFKQFIAVGGSQ